MAEKSKNLIKKQPVVVLVGHIDHGKSSILQKIRDFKITQKETGGITQHIGAYEIEENNKKITFIDTPGHEAFIAMRNRGAKVADIAVLVVAADQGVKPQTKEAISQIKQAGISMIVAINKIDKPDAQIERVKDALVNQGVMVENRGGDIPCIEVSAKTGKNIPELLELILLVDEMENFQTDSKNEAEGVIIESYLDAKKGPMATLLLESGALKQGDIVGTFSSIGKIKRMEDVQKKQIQKIEAGQAVLILGFEKAPIMGERFKVFADIEQARKNLQIKEIKFDIAPEIESSKKNLNLIIKTDVLGSIEPIKNIDIMGNNRFGNVSLTHRNLINLSNGPAKLCQALSINLNDNGVNLVDEQIYILDSPIISKSNIVQTTRIGITKSKELPLRFYIKDNSFVSRI